LSDLVLSSTILFGTLGNPGSKYSLTRHNIGFIFADKITSSHEFSDFTYCSKIKGYISSGKILDKNIVFVKPDTYMNLSGESINAAVKAFRIDTGNIFIVHDDVDIKFGRERIRKGGSDAGHRGIRSITAELGTEKYNRIRLGVGRSDKMSLPDFVLSNFIDDELKYIDNEWSAKWNNIVETVLEKGVSEAMNTFNRK
jgi:PTH1 family peptidyl-tRNA hydrolase